MVQFHSTYADQVLDLFETAVGSSARIHFYTDTQPANCASSSTGTLLENMVLPADWMAAASSGLKSLSGTWASTVDVSGSAGHFRIFSNTSTYAFMQGTIGSTSSTSEMKLTTTSLSSGGTLTITSFVLSSTAFISG